LFRVQPEGEAKKWGKLTITDALRTAKVPRYKIIIILKVQKKYKGT
jgi:hypothetical protein